MCVCGRLSAFVSVASSKTAFWLYLFEVAYLALLNSFANLCPPPPAPPHPLSLFPFLKPISHRDGDRDGASYRSSRGARGENRSERSSDRWGDRDDSRDGGGSYGRSDRSDDRRGGADAGGSWRRAERVSDDDRDRRRAAGTRR